MGLTKFHLFRLIQILKITIVHIGSLMESSFLLFIFALPSWIFVKYLKFKNAKIFRQKLEKILKIMKNKKDRVYYRKLFAILNRFKSVFCLWKQIFSLGLTTMDIL